MIFNETDLDGAFVIDIERIEDERGFYARTWDKKEFAARGLSTDIAQRNISYSPYRGTLRGMHMQVEPHSEVKLVRCVRGALYDVIIDLRPGSPSYLRWMGMELTAEDRRMLYVPKGFAHGFQTLTDDVEISYVVSEFYTPHAEAGVRWDDPAFGIEWPMKEPTHLSDKDRSWPDFSP